MIVGTVVVDPSPVEGWGCVGPCSVEEPVVDDAFGAPETVVVDDSRGASGCT